MSSENVEPKKGEILFYTTDDGNINLGVLFSEESVWLTQAQMVELFQRDRSVISRHIKNIFEEGELEEQTTIAKYAIVQDEGNRKVKRETTYYNLDVIIAVGYRVRSKQGTQFRIWATKTLREFIIKGFVLDYAENQAKKQIPMKMQDWVNKLNAFLQFNEYEILKGQGKISAQVAKKLADEQYNKFRIKQDEEYKSDFDKEIERYLK